MKPQPVAAPSSMSAVDEELSSYVASLPPPPMLARGREAWPRTGSGSWDVESLLGEQHAFLTNALARKIAEERAAHERDREVDALKADIRMGQDKIETMHAERRKFWSTVLAGIIVGFALGLGGWIAAVLLSASKK